MPVSAVSTPLYAGGNTRRNGGDGRKNADDGREYNFYSIITAQIHFLIPVLMSDSQPLSRLYTGADAAMQQRQRTLHGHFLDNLAALTAFSPELAGTFGTRWTAAQTAAEELGPQGQWLLVRNVGNVPVRVEMTLLA